jgi:hypothetical protein
MVKFAQADISSNYSPHSSTAEYPGRKEIICRRALPQSRPDPSFAELILLSPSQIRKEKNDVKRDGREMRREKSENQFRQGPTILPSSIERLLSRHSKWFGRHVRGSIRTPYVSHFLRECMAQLSVRSRPLPAGYFLRQMPRLLDLWHRQLLYHLLQDARIYESHKAKKYRHRDDKLLIVEVHFHKHFKVRKFVAQLSRLKKRKPRCSNKICQSLSIGAITLKGPWWIGDEYAWPRFLDYLRLYQLMAWSDAHLA